MSTPEKPPSPLPGHSIEVVSRWTGLSPDLLRAWEERYGAIRPGRTPTGRRVYSDEDVRRLRMLTRLTRGGRRIGEVAALGDLQLLRLVEAARARAGDTTPSGTTRPLGGSGAPEYVRRAIEAIEAFDAVELQSILSEALVALDGNSLVENVVSAIAKEVGTLWEAGRLDPFQEHAASAALSRSLGAVMEAIPAAPGAPTIVLGTPAGNRHGLGAMMIAAIAGLSGWRAAYLGPDLPAGDLLRATRRARARILGVSLVYPVGEAAVARELAEIGRGCGDDVTLLAGGRAAASYADTLASVGAVVLADTRAVAAWLGRFMKRSPRA